MENWVIILVVVLLILGSFGIYSFVMSRRIRNANIISYNLLECFTECSTAKAANTVQMLDEGCISVCNSYYGDIPSSLSDSEKIILNSVEHMYCLKIYEEQGGEEYKECLINMFPLLTDQYHYLEK